MPSRMIMVYGEAQRCRAVSATHLALGLPTDRADASLRVEHHLIFGQCNPVCVAQMPVSGRRHVTQYPFALLAASIAPAYATHFSVERAERLQLATGVASSLRNGRD